MARKMAEVDKNLPLPRIGSYEKVSGRDSAPTTIEVHAVTAKTAYIKRWYHADPRGIVNKRFSLAALQFRLFKSSQMVYKYTPFEAQGEKS